MKTKKKAKSSSRSRVRLLIQCLFAAFSNGYLIGFVRGKIYTGPLKRLCVPGLNCYSCPGAFGSCPVGSLQSALGAREFRSVLYVCGFLTLFGTLFGRLICGFLCPFGLIQDLLFRIPFFKKLRSLPGEKALRAIRFVLLAVLVILLPLFAVDATGLGQTWFCKYVCPAGTLEAGIPTVLASESLRSAVGFLYAWKIAILCAVVILSLLISRPFCRYLCPLGAIYGLFNRFALYRYEVDTDLCTGCGACRGACKLDIKVWENPNSIDCVRCGECRDACPTGAIRAVRHFKKKTSPPEQASDTQ